jgi:putative ABC transport system permease protein
LGIGIGIASGLLLAHFMSTMLFGISSSDPVTYAGVAILLLAVASVACYIPARSATKVDPITALRYE